MENGKSFAMPVEVHALEPIVEPPIDYAPVRVRHRTNYLDDLAFHVRQLRFGDVEELLEQAQMQMDAWRSLHRWAKER